MVLRSLAAVYVRLRPFLPFVGDRKALNALDEIVSRQILGAGFIGGEAGAVAGTFAAVLVRGATPVRVQLLAFHAGLLAVFILAFSYWHVVEESETVEEVKETASSAVEDAEQEVKAGE